MDTAPPPPACVANDAAGVVGVFADGGACCLFDPLKTVPGICGCGVPDTDTDGDGVPDCNDGCPKDRTRTTAGPCGCGVPDNTPLCLVHRYSFDLAPADAGVPSDDGGDAGTTSIVVDSVGGANGTAVNATLTGNGSIALVGGQYVSLPAGIISALGNSATFETWVTWVGGPAWQRIFDFGSSDNAGGIGPGVTGQTYIFMTPLNGLTSSFRGAFTLGGPAGEASLNSIAAVPTTVDTHLALVVDGVARIMTLYQNGAVVQVGAPYTDLGTGSVNNLAGLSGLNDVNNWLGRSQFAPDPGFDGTISEFRIYSVARSAAQIMASFRATETGLPSQ
jgi:hypothetical protein